MDSKGDKPLRLIVITKSSPEDATLRRNKLMGFLELFATKMIDDLSREIFKQIKSIHTMDSEILDSMARDVLESWLKASFKELLWSNSLDDQKQLSRYCIKLDAEVIRHIFLKSFGDAKISGELREANFKAINCFLENLLHIILADVERKSPTPHHALNDYHSEISSTLDTIEAISNVLATFANDIHSEHFGGAPKVGRIDFNKQDSVAGYTTSVKRLIPRNEISPKEIMRRLDHSAYVNWSLDSNFTHNQASERSESMGTISTEMTENKELQTIMEFLASSPAVSRMPSQRWSLDDMISGSTSQLFPDNASTSIASKSETSLYNSSHDGLRRARDQERKFREALIEFLRDGPPSETQSDRIPRRTSQNLLKKALKNIHTHISGKSRVENENITRGSVIIAESCPNEEKEESLLEFLRNNDFFENLKQRSTK